MAAELRLLRDWLVPPTLTPTGKLPKRYEGFAANPGGLILRVSQFLTALDDLEPTPVQRRGTLCNLQADLERAENEYPEPAPGAVVISSALDLVRAAINTL